MVNSIIRHRAKTFVKNATNREKYGFGFCGMVCCQLQAVETVNVTETDDLYKEKM